MWNGFKALVGNAYVFLFKAGKTYKSAAPAARGGLVKAAKTKGEQSASLVALSAGAPIVGLLTLFGFQKTEDATRTVGAIAIFASVVAVTVGGYIAIKRLS